MSNVPENADYQCSLSKDVISAALFPHIKYVWGSWRAALTIIQLLTTVFLIDIWSEQLLLNSGTKSKTFRCLILSNYSFKPSDIQFFF